MTNQKPPRCPRCDGKGQPTPGGLFKCTKFGGLYDSDPFEGGDYSDRNAGVRIEREERRMERRRR